MYLGVCVMGKNLMRLILVLVVVGVMSLFMMVNDVVEIIKEKEVI